MNRIKTAFRNAVRKYDHFIMTVEVKDLPSTNNNSFRIEKVTNDNINLCKLGVFNFSKLKKKLKADKTDGYLFFADNEAVGYMWTVMRGGKDDQYKVKYSDAFVVDVCIFEKHRGMGYSKEFFSYMKNIFLMQGIKTITLACAVENTVAHSLYQRLGFTTVKEMGFLRICKINFPYHSV